MKYRPLDKFPSNLKIILLTIGITLAFNVFGSAITLASLSFNFSVNPQIIQGLSQIIFLFGATILLSNIIPLKFKTLFRLEENIDFRFIGLGIVGLFFLNLFNTGYVSLQEYMIPNSLMPYYNDYVKLMESLYDKMLRGNDVYDFVTALVVGAVIPAISEEFLFRGFGQRALEENNSVRYSVFITGIIFGIIHFNFINLVPLILIGIFLGYLAYTSKSILVPIFIHFLNNAVSILLFYIEEPEIISDEPNLSLLNSILLSVVGLAGVILIIKTLFRFGNSKIE